jgi:predicted ester cyclase
MAHNYRKLAEQVYDIFTRGAIKEIPTAFSADFIEHEELPGSNATGLATVEEWITSTKRGISNIAYRLDSVVGQGDEAVCRVQLTGTHTGELFGAPATGNAIDVMIMDWVRISDDGKVAEHWGAFQEGQLMAQLGVSTAATAIDLTIPAATLA